MSEKCRDVSGIRRLQNRDRGALGHPWGLMGRLLIPSAKGCSPLTKSRRNSIVIQNKSLRLMHFQKVNKDLNFLCIIMGQGLLNGLFLVPL